MFRTLPLSVLYVSLAALAVGCSNGGGSGGGPIIVEPPVAFLYLDGIQSFGRTARPFPGGTVASLDFAGQFRPGTVRVAFWDENSDLFFDPPDSEFDIATMREIASVEFGGTGTYAISGSVPLDDGPAAQSELVLVDAVPFNARMRMRRTPDGRVPVFGIDDVEFEMVRLDRARVPEFELLGPGFFLPGMSSMGEGLFSATAIAGGVFSAETADRGLFTPRMTALSYTLRPNEPAFAFVPRAIWDGEAEMPRYEFVVGSNAFDFVIAPTTNAVVTAGQIEVRERGTGLTESFPLDVATFRTVVSIAPRSAPERIDVRASATFAGGARFVTEWLPALVVLE